MGYYPVFFDLRGKLCLVVGGGRIAERKVASLLDSGARVLVVSPELTPVLEGLKARGAISHRSGKYQQSDLAGVFLVICAVNDKNINQNIAADCNENNLPVNVVDQPDLCSFFVPAVMRRGDLTLAVSTGGKSPLLARRMKEELENRYGDHYGEFLDMLAAHRQVVIRQVKDESKKKEILEKMVTDEVLDLLRDNLMEQVKERLRSAYHHGGAKPQNRAGDG